MRNLNIQNIHTHFKAALRHWAPPFAVGAAAILAVQSAVADTTVTSGNTFEINNGNVTVVGSTTTWNEAGTLFIDKGATLATQPNQNSVVANNAAIQFTGTTGTITFNFNGNDTHFTLNGAITSAATGASTLAVRTGNGGNGDRESVTFYSAIPDFEAAGPLSLNVRFNTQTASQSFVNLNAVNTFTGSITLEKGNNVLDGYLSIGGVRTKDGNTVGSGSLGSGNFPGTIALDTGTFLNYDSDQAQILAGAISGAGSVIKTGSGDLTLSAPNTYLGNTTVSSGTLFLGVGGGLSFKVTDGSSNKVTGGGNATFDGSFTIDTSAVSLAAGSWTLVNTTGKTFNPSFSVTDFDDLDLDDIWTKTEGTKTWSFNESDGVLSLSSAATITAFGIPGASGVIDNNALTIQLYVTTGTDLATLAPTYTITGGTCDQPNDGVTPPTPNFSTGPVHYIVTDGATVNDYLVTVTESPMIFDGLVVWLKADAVNPADTAQVDGSGKVVQWNDSSGTNHHATNTTTGDRPSYVAGALNGQPVIRFVQDNDDNGDRLFLGDLSASFPTAGSMFAVVTPTDGRYNIFDNRANDSRWMANTWNEAVPGVFRNNRTNMGPFSLWPQSGSHVFAMESSSSAYRFVIDGTQIGSTGGDYSSGSVGQDWVIANRPGGGQALNGDIAEFILFNRVLSPEEAFQVGNYLSSKYGLTTAYIPALIKTFGIPGSAGVIDQNAKTIALTVPFGTDLDTLAPAFTLSSGTCDQTSESPPSPTFLSQNPATYTVTDGATVNAYSVEVTVTPASSAADILTFGPGATISGTDIAWSVPNGTDVTTLAPTYTVSQFASEDGTFPSGTTRDFTTPQIYTITAQDLSTQAFTVTVTILPPTTTIVIDLGAGTVIEGGTFGTYGAGNLPLPALPAGSILRIIEVNTVLESTDNDNWASELAVLLDPTPGTPGGDFSVGISNGDHFGAAVQLNWPGSANNGAGTALVDTKTAGVDFPANIDLNTTGLFLGNGYGGPTVGGTWSGTITLTYDVVGGGSDYDTWGGPSGYNLTGGIDDDDDGDSMTNRDEYAFGLNPTSGASVSPITVQLDPDGGTFTYTRRDPSLTNLGYSVWTSTDLGTWTLDGDAAEGVITTDGNNVQTVPVTLSAAALATAVDGTLFVRVQADDVVVLPE